MSAAVIRDLLVVQTRGLKLPASLACSKDSPDKPAMPWTHEDYLHAVLSAEEAWRHESVIRQRLHEARFPKVKTLESFDITAADSLLRNGSPVCRRREAHDRLARLNRPQAESPF